MDVGQFLGLPVLAPGDGAVAVENDGRMCLALVHEALLERPVVLPGLGPQPLVAARSWNHVHQQPPKMPLCRSTSVA